jgi:hypothetical protein
MGCHGRLTLAAALLAAGCGGATASGGDPDTLLHGSADADPSMEVLPEPDVPVEELSQRLRFAWLLAEESFDVDPPSVPISADVRELSAWADNELEPWLERKSARVEAARRELDLAAEESHRELILAGAVVGLLYEDVARVLLDIPVPEDLIEDREIADVYRNIIQSQARPYVEHARRAYRACSLNAVEPRGMRHFSEFCAGRRERLPSAGGGAGEEHAETTVTVSRDE